MKLFDLQEFIKLPAGTIYRKNYGTEIEIKGEWISDDRCDWSRMTFGTTGDSGVWSDMSYGESYPIPTSFYGRDGCFEDDVEFLVYESWDLEQLRLIIDQAIAVALPQKFKTF